jgi:hypothetical protein
MHAIVQAIRERRQRQPPPASSDAPAKIPAMEDPIVDEIHQYREEWAAKHNYDLRAMMADLQRNEQQENPVFVSPPPKPRLPALAEVKERVNELSAREQAAELTPEEKSELDDLLSLANLERLARERLKAVATTPKSVTPLAEKLAA